MKFSLEFANGGDEYKEEQERLKKGDPRGNKKGKNFGVQPFVPVEEIPGPDTLGDNENELEYENNEKDSYPSELLTEEEEEERMLGDFVKMTENIGFKQGEGVAHVGPEFNNDEKNISAEETPVLLDDPSEEEQHKGMSRSVKNVKDFSSLEKEFRGREFKGHDIHDNLKTFKKIDSKVEKAERGKTREILHAQTEKEPSWQDPRDLLDLSEN